METSLPLSPDIQKIITDALGAGLWVVLGAIVLFMFRGVVENIVAGLLIFVGKEIRPDDIVVLNGEAARIARVGLIKTTFYVYIIDAQGHVVSGKVIHIPHAKLQDQSICKPLSLFDSTFLELLKSESLNKKEGGP